MASVWLETKGKVQGLQIVWVAWDLSRWQSVVISSLRDSWPISGPRASWWKVTQWRSRCMAIIQQNVVYMAGNGPGRVWRRVKKKRALIACKWNRSSVGSSPFLEMIPRYSKCLQVFFLMRLLKFLVFIPWMFGPYLGNPILVPIGLSEDKRWEVEPWPQVLAFPWLQKGRGLIQHHLSQSYAETGWPI